MGAGKLAASSIDEYLSKNKKKIKKQQLSKAQKSKKK
jgi:hypothetical protein